MIEFDLQLFVDENENEKGTFEIPEGLEGIDEDLAKEIMAELQEEEQKIPEEQKESSAEPETKPPEVQVETQQQESEEIPYEEYRKTVEQEKAALQQEIERLKAQQQLPPTQSTPPAFPNAFAPAPTIPQFTPELLQQLEKKAEQEAALLTGVKKEELSEYEESERKTQYDAALGFARQRIFNETAQLMRQQQMQAQQQLEQHRQVLEEYQRFEQQESASPDFANIKQYAETKYFEKLTPVEQGAVREAYRRVIGRTCSPQDVFTVKQYFSLAAQDYRKTNSGIETPSTQVQAKKQKFDQMTKQPKVQQLSGNNSSGGINLAELTRMLEEKDWDEIPDQYKKILLGEV